MNRSTTKHTRTKPLAAASRAFTLIEVLLVMLIIGLLAGVVAYNLVGQADKARVTATKQSMTTIVTALKQYRAERGSYPSGQPGLSTLVVDGYLEEIKPDSWDTDYAYYSPTSAYPNGFELISAGPDKAIDTDDDLVEIAPADKVNTGL